MYTDRLTYTQDQIAVQEGRLVPTTLRYWIQPFVNRLTAITCLPMDVTECPHEGNGMAVCRDIFPTNDPLSDRFYNYRARYFVVRQDGDWRRLDDRILDVRYNLGSSQTSARVMITMGEDVYSKAIDQTYPHMSVSTAPPLEHTHLVWVIQTMLKQNLITSPRGYAQALIETEAEGSEDIAVRIAKADAEIHKLKTLLKSREVARDAMLRDLRSQG